MYDEGKRKTYADWRKYIHCLYTGESFPYKEILGDCPEKFTKCDFVAKAERLAEDEEEFRDILGYSVEKILAEVGDAMGKGVPENVMRCMLPFGADLTKEIIELSRRKKRGNLRWQGKRKILLCTRIGLATSGRYMCARHAGSVWLIRISA